MSGPKVDVAEVRRQEKERLVLARQCRQTVAVRIQQYINQISICLKEDAAFLIKDENIRPSYVKITQAQEKATKELIQLYDIVRNGNELLDVNEIQSKSDLLISEFKERVKGELELIHKLRIENQQLEQLEAKRQQMATAVRKKIARISKDKIPDHITQDDVNEQVNLFESEINKVMAQGDITSKHKNSLLLIHQDLKDTINSDISLDRKSKRIHRLFEEYENMISMVELEVKDRKAVYEEYCKECFDLTGTPKLFCEFTTSEEIHAAIDEVKNKAEAQISKDYVKRQIDEVMSKHGYDVVRSDLLEEANKDGQILYGVDQETAINVFISSENQVTMRVVGIGFDSDVSCEEDDKLYQQQCAFCSLHPQITAELNMRGVILHTKKHMPPDRKFNKKIQKKSSNNTQTISRAKKECKRTENKAMYKE